MFFQYETIDVRTRFKHSGERTTTRKRSGEIFRIWNNAKATIAPTTAPNSGEDVSLCIRSIIAENWIGRK